MTPISCSCDRCATMCAHSVCLPSPEDVRALIRAGYADRLAIYQWEDGSFIAPVTQGFEGEVLPRTNMGPCTFFDGKLCELHDKGLKPYEGKIAHHDRNWLPVRMLAVGTWKGKAFESVNAKLQKELSHV